MTNYRYAKGQIHFTVNRWLPYREFLDDLKTRSKVSFKIAEERNFLWKKILYIWIEGPATEVDLFVDGFNQGLKEFGR